MDEQRLIDALTARADEDARRFREQNPNDMPSDRWIENSYTAALPLARDEAGVDLGAGPHPQLFEVYKREISSRVGSRVDRREASNELTQQPTPGEN
jgi:hypothetical protein